MTTVIKSFFDILDILYEKKTIILGLGLGITAFGVWLGLFQSPIDYQQGEYVRLMYVHVPCAWGAMAAYGAVGALSLLGLVYRQLRVLVLAYAFAPCGLFLCIASLITGSLWGKPIWGTYWVWDARLTSMLFLAILYISYIGLVGSMHTRQKGYQMGGFLSLFGCINLPIIKWSVHLWSTLHQKESVQIFAKSTLHARFKHPLYVMAFGLFFICFWTVLMVWRKKYTELKEEHGKGTLKNDEKKIHHTLTVGKKAQRR
jgi:heme exporter protein C